MLDLTDDIFEARFEIVAGGSGYFRGIVDEPNQTAPPSYIFTSPRRTLRVSPKSPIGPGIVIKTELGQLFMVGSLGPSEHSFRSFRLFEATHRMQWSRRLKVIDPITRLEKDAGLSPIEMIYCAYEPDQGQLADGTMHSTTETGRLITAAPVLLNDLVDAFKVNRVDVLGQLRICNLV